MKGLILTKSGTIWCNANEKIIVIESTPCILEFITSTGKEGKEGERGRNEGREGGRKRERFS